MIYFKKLTNEVSTVRIETMISIRLHTIQVVPASLFEHEATALMQACC